MTWDKPFRLNSPLRVERRRGRRTKKGCEQTRNHRTTPGSARNGCAAVVRTIIMARHAHATAGPDGIDGDGGCRGGKMEKLSTGGTRVYPAGHFEGNKSLADAQRAMWRVLTFITPIGHGLFNFFNQKVPI